MSEPPETADIKICRIKTGITMHAWATEDVCATCAAPSILDLLGTAEDR